MLPWKPEFWSDLAQNLMQPIPTPIMLQMKFYFDRPTGLRDIYVWKCGRTDGRSYRWILVGNFTRDWYKMSPQDMV